ncbi:MAG: thiamine phosphate synthase [Alphaproteobacteria bacterium]
MPTTLTEHADRLNLRCAQRNDLPAVILVTDGQRLADPVAALGKLRPGDAVLLRHYDAPHRVELARALAVACRARRIRLIVGGDSRLARAVGAQGIHVPQGLVTRASGLRHNGFLVTAAAHDWAGLIGAYRAGVDAILLSPVFATASHPGAPHLGVHRFAAWVRRSPVPVYALGGVTATTAGRLTGSGAVGIAAVGAFTS